MLKEAADRALDYLRDLMKPDGRVSLMHTSPPLVPLAADLLCFRQEMSSVPNDQSYHHTVLDV